MLMLYKKTEINDIYFHAQKFKKKRKLNLSQQNERNNKEYTSMREKMHKR